MLTKPPFCMRTSPLMAVVIDHHGYRPFIQTKRCKLRSFTHLDFAHLELGWTDADAASLLNLPSDTSNSFHRSFSTPCLSTATKVPKNPNTSPRIDIVAGRGALGIRALVVEASIALASGIEPVAASSGLGGAYYLRNRGGESIAVIKPIVEDPTSALSNPTVGYGGRILGQPDLVRSVRAGETGVREVAAYLLDHNNFVGVPPTALIKVSNLTFHTNHAGDAAAISPSPSSRTPKMASIQRFVPHNFDAGELGPSGFSVASVHRIGILDVRLLNIDRHAGNILVKKKINRCSYDSYVTEGCTIGAAELVPIDHGLCLPESLDDPYFEWLHWPQASVPFSDTELEYINKLDPCKDAELLQTELPLLRESCIRILVLCTVFLKRAADAGLCLADIGDMMTREFRGTEEEPSLLETLCMQANATFDLALDFATEGEDEANDGFQFDMDCHEEDHIVDVLNIPHLLQSHPQVTESRLQNSPLRISTARSMTEYPHAVLSPLHEGDDDDGENEDNGNDDDDCKEDGRKVRCLPKSVSLSVMQHKHECNDISFKEMGEEEWKLFLERFEELLPNAFESRRNMGLKQRLGTSCKF